MVPLLLLALAAVVLVMAVVAVAGGRLAVDPLADAVSSTPDHGLPDRPSAADVDDVRFDTAPRGYRMQEVDVRLAALRDDLRERERVLDELGAPVHDEPGEAVPDDRGEPEPDPHREREG